MEQERHTDDLSPKAGYFSNKCNSINICLIEDAAYFW